MKKTITIFSGLAKLNKNIVGTAVVYHQLAYFLNKEEMRVNLIVPEKSDNEIAGVNYFVYDQANNKKIVDQSQIVVFGSYPPFEPLAYAAKRKKNIITYMWSIAPLGSLEFSDFSDLKRRVKLHNYIVDSYNFSLELSNKIFCRDARARDLILGSLISLGRAGILNYQDRNFKHLLEIAPFGLDAAKPKHLKNIYRGVIPGITKKDFILLWNGGVWNRTDAPGMVEIMKYIWQKDKRVKLIFQGFHNPHKIYSQEAKQTKQSALKHKLLNKNVFIPGKWIPYDERGDYLIESDAGIALSPNIPDANFLIKTRYYDYLWAELPIILNNYDTFAAEVGKNKLGMVLHDNNYKHQAAEIINFSRNKKARRQIKKNIREYKRGLSWQQSLKPVIDYCRQS